MVALILLLAESAAALGPALWPAASAAGCREPGFRHSEPSAGPALSPRFRGSGAGERCAPAGRARAQARQPGGEARPALPFAAPRAGLRTSATRTSATPSPAIAASAYRASFLPGPFRQASLYYLALLFLGIFLPAQLFRRHAMVMKGRFGIVLEERSRIARECHDTLMAGFAAISWQLEAASKLLCDGGLAATPGAEACELARSMVSHCQDEARRIIWDLRETEEIADKLSQALARPLALNRGHKSVGIDLEVQGTEIALAPGCVHHLVCIVQEAVTNALRHGNPSRIAIRLQYEASALCLTVRDDGSGFHPSDRQTARHGHFGIAVMQERARKVGGSFRIQALAGRGTEITVRTCYDAVRRPAQPGQQVIRWIGI